MTLYDTTLFINQSIHAVYQTLFEAGVLVLIVIMLFLQNFRAMLVPATTVPVTIIGAFAAMALLGFTVNLMTLFALILVHRHRGGRRHRHRGERLALHRAAGCTPKDAAIEAMSELTGPVLGITLVLTAVFLPASFLPGITGQMFRQFALVIAATAIISAINALTLKPTQCALYLRPVAKDRKAELLLPRLQSRSTAPWRLATSGVVELDGAPPAAPCSASSSPSSALAAAAVRDLSDGARAARRPGLLHRHRSSLPPGASQPRVREVAADIDAILKGRPGIKGWVTIGGYSALDSAKLSNVVTAFVIYEDWDQSSPGRLPDEHSRNAPAEGSLHPQRARSRSAALPHSRAGQRLRVSDGRRRSRRERPRRAAKNGAGDSRRPRATGRDFCASDSRPSVPAVRSSTWTWTGRWRNRSESRSTTSPRRCRPIWDRPSSTCSTSSIRASRSAYSRRRILAGAWKTSGISSSPTNPGKWFRSAACSTSVRCSDRSSSPATISIPPRRSPVFPCRSSAPARRSASWRLPPRVAYRSAWPTSGRGSRTRRSSSAAKPTSSSRSRSRWSSWCSPLNTRAGRIRRP